MSSNTPNLNLLKVNPVTDGNDTFNIDTMLNDNWDKIDTTVGNKVDKVSGKQLSTNDYTTAEKTKLSGVATGANNYTHPTGDGNQHVPATGTSNNGKVLKAGTTAGSLSWGNVNGSEVVEDATHRFATDTEKVTWNAKETTIGSQAKADAAVLPINNRLNTESLTSINLAAGQQILNATKNARLQGLKVQGRTLIDLLGGAGSGESLTSLSVGGTAPTLSNTQKRGGATSVKFAPSANTSYLVKDFTGSLDATKYYVLAGWLFIESYTTGAPNLSLRDVGTVNGRYSAPVNTALVGQWQFVYAKVPTNNELVGSGFRVLFGATGTTTCVIYWDEIRLYAVSTADYAAIGTTITGEAIDRLLPYVPPGINGVDGLWVRRYGKNLLPDRSQFVMRNNVTALNWVGPGTFDLTTTAANSFTTALIDVLPNTVYTLSVDADPNINIAVYNANGTTALATYAATARTFNSGSNTQVQMYFRNTAAGTTRYNNVQFEIGSTATTFQPREDSLLAFSGVELHANPNDGSEPDILREVNGRYEVTRLWREMVLDGSLPWTFQDGFTGFKRVSILRSYFGNMIATSALMAGVKHNGQPLTSTITTTGAPDTIGSGPSYLNLSISSADSGWGESYTPISAEIQAYFYGWKMCNADTGAAYNGSGAKGWGRITEPTNVVGQGGWAGLVTTLPTVPAGVDGGGRLYSPYQLLYRLASPITETVQEDGSLSLIEGDNFIEVGSGYVSRERANPVMTIISNSAYYHFNNAEPTVSASKFRYPVQKILGIYEASSPARGVVLKNESAAFGLQDAHIEGINYNLSAPYSASYIKLDKSPVPVVTGFYAATEKGQLHDLTDAVTEIGSAVSVLAAKKAEKDAGPWITPSTLLNGFTGNQLSYRKNGNYVEFKGFAFYNVIDAPGGTIIMNLPAGFRPLSFVNLPTTSWGDTGALSPSAIGVYVGIDGIVQLSVPSKRNVLFDGLRFPLD
ncbi:MULTISPECIES: hypothetical protein [Paenibacillus]|uniref:hypothetical protein n=1 Tax=Paenibacillus TaxID=44249 RepID=UPI00096D5348|nr:hypothetical protein [Paenibacillus odorifer]OMD10005.1 hypothetical protein BJP50_28840 [Paenibacillus odorifer]